MTVYVCIKHVPDTAATIKVSGGAGFDEGVKFVMSPYDEYAVEEASATGKKEGCEVVVVSLGKAAAANTIRSALAVGADRGILVTCDAQFMDSAVTAKALAAAIGQDGTPAMVFAGKQSADSEGMQTHYRLAAALGMPVATEVVEMTLKSDRVVVACEAGGGDREVLEMPRPCIVGATKGLNEPRYPKLPDILKAKKKPIKEVPLTDLRVDPGGAQAKVASLEPVPERGAAAMLSGSVPEMVTELVSKLREAKVLEG